MLLFAAILTIAAIGQALVIQQRELNLSVPGIVSLAALILTRYSNLDDDLVLPCIFIATAVLARAEFLKGSKPEDVDNAMKLGVKHPMEPLELADLVGLDVIVRYDGRALQRLSRFEISPLPLHS
jgi:3-hydroxyacyl-CoA dehydrogenase-like protein